MLSGMNAIPLPEEYSDIFLFSYFASGTGGAGLAGAAMWWFVRSLGVQLGIGLSAVTSIPCSSFENILTHLLIGIAIYHPVGIQSPPATRWGFCRASRDPSKRWRIHHFRVSASADDR